MLIDENIINELKKFSTDDATTKAKELANSGEIALTKIKYENSNEFSIHARVMGGNIDYFTYIEAQKGNITNVSCTCPDYEDTYGTCKHILATAYYFNQAKEYNKMFQGDYEDEHLPEAKENDERYRIYRQMINTFYEQEQKDAELKIHSTGDVKIEPKLLYNYNSKELKVEFKIGTTQMYKIKNLVDFFNRMQTNQKYRYGLKLEFIHSKEAFSEESQKLLDFVMKYSEIIKYANESANYYANFMNTASVVLSNTGMDDLFEAMKGKSAEYENQYGNQVINFIDNEPNIKFEVKDSNTKNEFKITTSTDVYDYSVIPGKNYKYFLQNNNLYKCSKSFDKNVLTLLNIFKVNFTKEIPLKKTEFADFYSLIIPAMKDNFSLNKIDKESLEKYLPKELKVKVFLDINQSNFVTADVKFKYDNFEFSPFENIDKLIPRNAVEESKALDLFKNAGFMLDIKNNKLILTSEDRIYDFLKVGVEEFIKRFEVLATEDFKSRQIISPKLSSIGVKIENNLLSIDLSEIDIDKSEFEEIMKKYSLKKRFHRLKNGQFVDLENNKTLDAIEKISESVNIDYKELSELTIKVPVYRSLYLDKILKQNEIVVKQSEEYKDLIDDVYNRQISDKYSLPKSLNANLREYQKVGFDWLKTLDDYRLGGILADDMGLGKTLQLIAVILSYKEETEQCEKLLKENKNEIKGLNTEIEQKLGEKVGGSNKLSKLPSLVICPSSLALNWQEETKKFAPTLKTMVISGTSEERRKQINKINNYDIAITSYDLLKRDLDIYKEKNYMFRYLVADEAQYIKNNTTKNAKAIKEIKAITRFALTGTPIENSLAELWSIFDFIMPGYLFNYNKFKTKYESPIIKENDQDAMNRLKNMIEPFVLRRIKEKVLTELPDKTITVLNNEMEDEQLNLYLSYMKQAKKQAKEEIETNGVQNSQIKILALLMRLRQICCHPGLFLENYNEGSKKLQQCIEIIKNAVDGGHKILLFSGYSSMFPYIENELKELRIKYFKLTGQTKVSERMDLVNDFNDNDDVKVFLISLKAGGTGLNLIGADMVIHYDPWWNLSAENQATDRTYRIGQKRNVQVYKLITKNSIEEKIYNLQEKKAKLANDMLSTNETFISKLSKDEILDLFN